MQNKIRFKIQKACLDKMQKKTDKGKSYGGEWANKSHETRSVRGEMNYVKKY